MSTRHGRDDEQYMGAIKTAQALLRTVLDVDPDAAQLGMTMALYERVRTFIPEIRPLGITGLQWDVACEVLFEERGLPAPEPISSVTDAAPAPGAIHRRNGGFARPANAGTGPRTRATRAGKELVMCQVVMTSESQGEGESMKCKHCGAALVPVTIYVDASSLLNTAGYAAAQPPVLLAGWQPVEHGATVYFPNAAAAAPRVPSVFSTPCQHEPEPDVPNTTGIDG